MPAKRGIVAQRAKSCHTVRIRSICSLLPLLRSIREAPPPLPFLALPCAT